LVGFVDLAAEPGLCGSVLPDAVPADCLPDRFGVCLASRAAGWAPKLSLV